MYGKWHSRKRLVSLISSNYQDPEWIASLGIQPPQEWLEKLRMDQPYPWLEELNLDPTNRVAAGLGALIVQELQEESDDLCVGSSWASKGSE